MQNEDRRTLRELWDDLNRAWMKMSELHIFYPGTGATRCGTVRAVIRHGLRLARKCRDRDYPIGNMRAYILKAFQYRDGMPLGPTVALVERLTGLALRAGVDMREVIR